jgi:hypothetical protein
MLPMSNWPFADPPDTGVYTTQPVLDGAPVLDVHHDEDGDWQILCGTTIAVEDGRLVHFAHLVEMTPSLTLLADLPRGWWARWSDERNEWHRRPRNFRSHMRWLLRRR